jgi:hypothetical protein
MLLSESGTDWDMDTVRTLFSEEIAEEIQKIPISKHGGDNFAAWPFDRFGTYTVKSAYYLARTEKFFSCQGAKNHGGGSDIGTQGKDWKALWAILAPEKMKIVLWSMVHDCLPTGFQLRYRQIIFDDSCTFCSRSERVEHLFLFCPSVKELVPMQLMRHSFSDMRSWLFEFIARSLALQRITLAVSCWQIWEARNDARNEQRSIHPVRVATKIKAYVDNIVEHCFKTSAGPKEGSKPTRWVPPSAGVLCVNVNAAIFKQENQMGWGAVVRDHGGLKLACNESINDILSPELAEATAIQRALSVSKDKGFKDIVLVSDCLSMIQRIMSAERDRSGVGLVVGDIKKLATEFSTCIFKHSSRRANVAAHC